MIKCKYIMITSWDGYWDMEKRSMFTHGFIRHPSLTTGPWPESETTLFIKVNKNNIPERCWAGTAANFEPGKYKGKKEAVYFDVQGLTEVDCPEECRSMKEGWHLKDVLLPDSNELEPPFFTSIAETRNGLLFEKYCYQLLRLLGLHELYTFPQNNNSGKADGFFKFGSLTVLYDSTLRSEHEKVKETQIDNYISQLDKDKIHLQGKGFSIKETTKQVWIITKGDQVRILKTEDDIKVKEIPYTKLIAAYNHRLTHEAGLNDFCDFLKNL
jgi:hypothetical protein